MTYPDDRIADLDRAEARHEASRQRYDAAHHEIATDDGWEVEMLQRSLTSDALSEAGRQVTIERIAWLTRGRVALRLAAE